jgi:hypothetical protein
LFLNTFFDPTAPMGNGNSALKTAIYIGITN